MTVAVGHEFPERTFYVDPVRVEEFLQAVGLSPAPDYRPTIGSPVPPGFMIYVSTYGAEEIHEALDMDMMRSFFGGTDQEFLHPLRIGETLTVQPKVTAITKKSGSAGNLTFMEITTEYRRDDGVIALRERSTTVQRG